MRKSIALLIAILFVVSLIPTTFAQKNIREGASEGVEEGTEESEETVIAARNTERIEARLQAMALTAEQIRGNQEERLRNAVNKCQEGNKSPELCEKKLETRLQLIIKLKEKDLERLQKIEAIKQQKLEELKAFLKDPKLSKYKKENDFRAREIAQNILAKSKEKYLKAKEKYQKSIKEYGAAQDSFREAKNRLKECEGEDTAECNQLREEIKERAQEFLLKTADSILDYLNTVKANVESNEDLSEEESAEILAKIDEMIQEIEDAKSTIESSESKDEIIEAARTIKKAWLRIRKQLAIHTGKITNARIGGIIVKTKQLEVKLERILSRMEEKGTNTTQIQSLVDDFGTKIGEAKTNYEDALDKFKEAASAEDVKTAHELAVEAHKLIKAAQKSLQEAQKLLRDIVLSIKQAGGEDELNAPEDEAEEEAEEEDEEEVEDDEECAVDGDCEEGEVCKDGECEDAEEEDEEEVEDECTVDEDCEEGDVCKDGECEEPTNET